MSNDELFNKAKGLKAGDLIRVHRLRKMYAEDGVTFMLVQQNWSAKIKSVSVGDSTVDITYEPCDLPDSVQCAWGHMPISDKGNNSNRVGKYGVQDIEVVGYKAVMPYSNRGNGWMVGHPGYDSIH